MTDLVLSIKAVGRLGDGLADHGEETLAVPGALPGERVRVAREGKALRRIEIEAASPERQAPECRHFGTCGGCAVQHWADAPVAEWKRDRVRRALAAQKIDGDILPVRPAHGAGRRRVTLHLRRSGNRPAAGFMRAKTHELIDLDACPLLVPALASAPELGRRIAALLAREDKPLDLLVTACRQGLDAELRGSGPLGEAQRKALVALATEAGLARLTLHGERIVERAPPDLALGGGLFAFLPPGPFLQPTEAGEAALFAEALARIEGARKVADLFCGLGPFSLRLARLAKVDAFDSDKPAIAALERSIRANPGGKPARAEARDLFRRPLYAPELAAYDAVLLDPPRQGAEAQIREIAKSKLARLAYVSCDPESFARDAAILLAVGFRMGPIQPVDQFRHSPHIEVVAGFAR